MREHPVEVRLESGLFAPVPEFKSYKPVAQWLYNTAMADAYATGNDYIATLFEREDPRRLPQATMDALNLYLFGSENGINLVTGERL